MDSHRQARRPTDRRLTCQDALVGTPEYMSPEQLAADADIDARSDVWGFCVLLHEVISGQRPFEAASARELFAAIVAATPPSLEELGFADERLSDIVLRGLAKAREERWGSMRELGAALAQWAADAGITEPPLSRWSAAGVLPARRPIPPMRAAPPIERTPPLVASLRAAVGDGPPPGPDVSRPHPPATRDRGWCSELGDPARAPRRARRSRERRHRGFSGQRPRGFALPSEARRASVAHPTPAEARRCGPHRSSTRRAPAPGPPDPAAEPRTSGRSGTQPGAAAGPARAAPRARCLRPPARPTLARRCPRRVSGDPNF